MNFSNFSNLARQVMDSVHWTVNFSHGSDIWYLMAFALIRSAANQEGAQAKTATEDSCAIQRGELASFPSSAPDEAVKKDLAERVSRVAQLEAALVPWHTASCRYLMSSRCIMSSPLNSRHSMPLNH